MTKLSFLALKIVKDGFISLKSKTKAVVIRIRPEVFVLYSIKTMGKSAIECRGTMTKKCRSHAVEKQR